MCIFHTQFCLSGSMEDWFWECLWKNKSPVDTQDLMENSKVFVYNPHTASHILEIISRLIITPIHWAFHEIVVRAFKNNNNDKRSVYTQHNSSMFSICSWVCRHRSYGYRMLTILLKQRPPNHCIDNSEVEIL